VIIIEGQDFYSSCGSNNLSADFDFLIFLAHLQFFKFLRGEKVATTHKQASFQSFFHDGMLWVPLAKIGN